MYRARRSCHVETRDDCMNQPEIDNPENGRLRLLPEIQCYPTWVYRNGMYDNVSPNSLGISAEMGSEWVVDFDPESLQ